MYKKNDEFGTNVKGHSFNKPRIEKVEYDSRNYDTDQFNKTRHRTPAAIINANSPARP